jgi:hypothetical protein
MGAPYTVVDFIADELRAAAPDGEWHIYGTDRARELAQIFVRVGVRDLSLLALVRTQLHYNRAAWTDEEVNEAYSFTYEGRIIGFMGTPDEPSSATQFEGLTIAWSSEGKGAVSYMIQPGPNGGYVIKPIWGSSSDWGTFRWAVRLLASSIVFIALPVAGVAVAPALGAAIVGPTMAAAIGPVLTGMIGQFVLAAVFTGGDIEEAAKLAVLSAAGAQIGQFVGQGATLATDLEIVGKVAGAATNAFIQGGDPERAAAVALLQNAGDVVEIFYEDPALMATYTADPAQWNDTTYQEWTPGGPVTVDVNSFIPQPGVYQEWTPEGPVSVNTNNFTQPQPGVYQEWTPDGPVTVRVEPAAAAPPPPRSITNSGGLAETRDVVNTISQSALAALNIVGAYRRLDNPPANPVARSTNAQGAVVTALPNGTVQTRYPDGRVTVTRPPTGVPQSTVGGDVVVNNGDGTFSLIDRSGNRRVIQYDGTSSEPGIDFSDPKILLGAAAALGGLLFLMRRRR